MSQWDRYGGEGRHGHRLERGDLRFVILDLLESRPSYGYELIRALEERFHGFYTPSPGTVYPTLQWLEDLGYVTVVEQDGRKVYTITDEGRRFLAARQPQVDEIWERMRSWWGPFDKKEFRDDMHELLHDLRDLGRDLRKEARWATPEKMRRVRDVAMRAGKEIEDILRESDPQAPRPDPTSRPASETRSTPPSGPTEAARDDVATDI